MYVHTCIHTHRGYARIGVAEHGCEQACMYVRYQLTLLLCVLNVFDQFDSCSFYSLRSPFTVFCFALVKNDNWNSITKASTVCARYAWTSTLFNGKFNVGGIIWIDFLFCSLFQAPLILLNRNNFFYNYSIHMKFKFNGSFSIEWHFEWI